jgi:pimeloyl-ACP methyl ester carboxylesterase
VALALGVEGAPTAAGAECCHRDARLRRRVRTWEAVVVYVEVNGLRIWHEVRGDGHFPVVYAKTVAMLATEPELELASLAAVTAPTLVLQGDRDEVTLEHGAAVAAILPQGRLAVLPGTHALPVENPGVVNALLLWFLAGAAPGRRPTLTRETEGTS